MTVRFLNHAFRRGGLFLALLFLWFPLTTLGQLQSVGDFLDEQGRLAISPGFSGSLDPSGFEMKTAADGTPRFVTQGGVAQGSLGNVVQGGWQAFGGARFGCNGTIDAIAIDANGVVYLGGRFAVCGDTAANRIVAFDPETNEFHSLGSGGQNGVTFSVFALAVSDGNVYAGGFFSVARWDGSQWHTLGDQQQNAFSGGWVRALAVSGGEVYAGGEFTEAAGQPANHVARSDGNQWHALESGGQNGVNDDVLAMAVSAGNVYIGGRFTEAGGQPADRVARWDGNQWHALETGGQNGVSGSVRAVAVAGGDVYIGGFFSEAGGQPANNMARWIGGQWHALGNGEQNGVNARVWALIVSNGDIYVGGGQITRAGGKAAKNVARWDGGQWHALESGGQNGVNSTVFAMAFLNGDLYVGGALNLAGGQSTSHVASWDGSAWHALGAGGQNGFSGTVSALAVSGSEVYVGGDFTEAGGQRANNVVRWDGSQWHSLGIGEQNGIRLGLISALAVSRSDVYAGGIFRNSGAQSANFVARWDGNQWHALESGGQNGVNDIVNALAVSGSDLYVGGRFTEAGGVPANRVARWDGSNWHALGSGGQNGVSGGSVMALVVLASDVYVGGRFTEAGGETANRMARWGGSGWHALESGGQNGVSSWVDVLTVFDGDIYVGGSFFLAGGQAASRIARWDGVQWHALDSGGQIGVNSTVRAMSVLGDQLYIGGDFTEAGGLAPNRVASWDGNRWRSLGSGGENGVSSRVSALAMTTQGIHVGGGSFGLAGCEVSSSIATFVEDTDLIFRSNFDGNTCLD